MINRLLFSIMTILWMASAGFSQNVVFVSGVSGADNITCGGLGSPCQTIQYAADSIAISGDTVLIDTGVYSLPAAVGADTPVVQLPEGKSLSFVGTTSGLGTRINGSTTRRGFLYYYMGGSCETGSPNDGIADSLVFSFQHLIVEDCKITEMCGSTSYAYGGGMRLDCDSGSTLQVFIDQCVFRDNQSYDVPGTWAGGRSASGGAVFIYGRSHGNNNPGLFSEAHITNCDFSGNFANQNWNGGHGGAILLRDLDTASVVTSSFCDNYVYSQSADNGDLQHDRNAGGAICFYDMFNGTPGHGYRVDDCSFINNSATTNSGGTFANQSEGGAIFLTKGDVLNATNTATVTISNTQFFNNTIETGVEHIDNNGGTIDTSSVGFNYFYDQFQIDLGDDTSICIGDSLTIDASLTGANYLWSTGQTTSTIIVSDSGTYSVTASVGSCAVSDTIVVSLQDFPSVDLGPDSTLCPYDSLMLDAFENDATYNWSGGSNDSVIFAQGNGVYWVEVDLNGCVSTDTVVIDTIALPTNAIGPDTILCPNQTFVEDASTPGGNYLWQDGSTTPTHLIQSPGTYVVTVSKAYCELVDSIEVFYVDQINQIVMEDTIACEGDSVSVQVIPSGMDQITWSDGSGDSLRYFTQPGTYSVTVDDRGCLFDDEITISFKPLPSIELGNDTSFCEGEQMQIDVAYPGASYSWSNGFNSPYFTITASGVYVLTLTYNGCDAVDDIEVTVHPLPHVELPDTIHFCEDQEYTYHPSSSNGDYVWNTGSVNDRLKVNEPGFYAVTVTENGCTSSAASRAFVSDYPVFDLGLDTQLCEGRSFLLSPGLDSVNYQWQDKSTEPALEVESGGKYWVTIDRNGCARSDTLRVKQKLRPRMDLPEDTLLCMGESYLIELSAPQTIYLWNGTNHSSSYLADKEETITVEAESQCGKTRDSIRVSMEQCDCSVYIPNAFTPVLNNQNDFFEIAYDCRIVEFEFKVYDRWGHEIFRTTDPDFRWDGRMDGVPIQLNTYTYLLNYSYQLETGSRPVPIQKHGMIHVIW